MLLYLNEANKSYHSMQLYISVELDVDVEV